MGVLSRSGGERLTIITKALQNQDKRIHLDISIYEFSSLQLLFWMDWMITLDDRAINEWFGTLPALIQSGN